MKKYAIIGAGHRARAMFAKPLVSEYGEFAQLIAIVDQNKIRAQVLSAECGGVPVFDDFDEMIQAMKPDVVIVVVPDVSHDEYIIRALEADCDVITEKPMTINGEKCKAILEAERRTKRNVTVTFNLRFNSYLSKVKELIMAGAVGTILNVHFEWFLDTVHGADYFRRWHSQMANSGGLLVHKSTHHFDIINWWIDDEPSELYAFGTTQFYGPVRQQRGERCLTCQYKHSCEFHWDILEEDFMKAYYYNAEEEGGYIRDRCVFGEHIDIYDTMSVNARYARGALLTYSLIAHSPCEGWKATINGTRGRIELAEYLSGEEANNPDVQIVLYDRYQQRTVYSIPKSFGAHGGSDTRIRESLFKPDESTDPLGQQAGSRAGAMSLLMGEAANISIARKIPVKVRDLLE